MKHIILASIIAASSAVQAAVIEHKLPAPMPEFKTPEQLAKWREEKTKAAAAADSPSAIRDSQFFYTGKPYLQETGSYAFKGRAFDPEMNRWTTVDPSGFPDGANNHSYVNNMATIALDPSGLTIYTYSSSYFRHQSWTETLYPDFQYSFPLQVSGSFTWQNSSGTSTNYFGTHQSDVALSAGMSWITGELVDSTTDSNPIYGNYLNIPYTSRSVDEYLQTNWHATYE